MNLDPGLTAPVSLDSRIAARAQFAPGPSTRQYVRSVEAKSSIQLVLSSFTAKFRN